MKTTNLFWNGLLHATGTVVYIALISLLMFYGKNIFSGADSILNPIAMLSLLVLSATIVGTLMLGRPVLWYLNGAKSEAVKLFLYSLICLLGFTVLFLVLMATVFKTTSGY